ncbi:multidrug resistance-associated ABC transporter [Irpex rosettiformis]|uniref:Multidrug resistance-associated ABC transporter n=1 Tax=Irpex rosettiformis TaxID=378272 RepID=A0ACB8TUC3_9APHY|nr:multidrug resistance-associated ABC transporter [Irpex rosettiformis]
MNLVNDASVRVHSEENTSANSKVQASKHLVSLSGLPIASLNLLRFLSSLALFGLQVYTLVLYNNSWAYIALTATYAYVVLLSGLTLFVGPINRRIVTTHLVTVLFVSWAISAYRNLWPLATFNLKPADGVEGALLWIKFGLLTVIGVVIPLIIPREYRPYDPQNPSPEPHPEQTASILSMTIYTYMTPLVWTAAHTPHLGIDQLPRMADGDEMKNLVHRGFDFLDPLSPKAQGHIFWGLIRVFCKVFLIGLPVLSDLGVFFTYLSPIGVNRILSYLETGGSGSQIRPWFWCIWLFLGPFSASVIMSRYSFSATRLLAQSQGLLSELIFEHSLRIRVTSQTSSDKESSTQPSTLDSASVAESSILADDQEQEGVREGAESTAESRTKASVNDGSAETEKNQKDKDLTGRINNLLTADISALEDGQLFLLNIFFGPPQVIFSVIFLYMIIGWSVFIGFGFMVVLSGLPGLIGKMLHSTQVAKMKASDARVQTVTETIGGAIRMIKLFGWEDKINKQIDGKRSDELKLLRKQRLLILWNVLAMTFIPVVTMLATFATYTLVMKEQLTPSRIFPCMSVFQILRFHFLGFSQSLNILSSGKVALDRINKFLHETELLDTFNTDKPSIELTSPPTIAEAPIGFRAASFTWNVDSDSTFSRRRKFRLTIENEVIFKRGKTNLIVGQTGCGKTSMLMALLGEMHYIPLDTTSLVSLPRDKGIAYHAQESWVLNETIKNNILFGSPFDSERYAKVIKQCALERDLDLFEVGDETEVGERGVTLSGGQKARITLARAVYSSAAILLLDDVLAALDVHTSQHIVDQCLKGDLVRGRTVILVTHNLALTAPIADLVVSLTPDGRIQNISSHISALEADADTEKDVRVTAKTSQDLDDDNKVEQVRSSGGKLIVKEEMEQGRVEWSAMNLLFRNTTSSGFSSLVFWVSLLLIMFASRSASVLETWVLSRWAKEYEYGNLPPLSALHYMYRFIGVVLVSSSLVSIAYTMYILGIVRAVRVVHQLLINSVLHATMRWLDTTPTSRITTRCTQDIASIDGPVIIYIHSFLDCLFDSVTKFIGVIVMSPIFAIPGAILGLLGCWIGDLFIRAQLSIKREMSSARAPVLGHVGAAIAGLVSIRAYGAQEAFILECHKRIDRYTLTARTFWNLTRWLAVRTETLSGLFAAGLAVYLVYSDKKDAASTGFSLTMAVGFSSMILYLVRMFNQFQINGNSLERIQQYLVIDHEPKATEGGIPPAYWPASGDLRVENLSAKYSSDGPNVLNNISFHIKSGERVGIVGRTGSGKSSLTLALLRCILTTGKVYFDGILTDDINLDALRTGITIIPQVPDLLSGTLRENIDPFSQYDDAVINDALRAAGLYFLQKARHQDEAREEEETGNLTLDTTIVSNGGNLSVGQRQIIALARAIVRRSRLLILDEATSAIDYETDSVIQASLRNEVARDVTLLTVAHRLQTIMDYDKIMVLDAGDIMEFGTPVELLKNKDGFLTGLVDASGDKTKLYELAAQAAS